MTDNREIIEMLKILKEQSLKSHNDTAVLEVKIDSFNFVLDEAIKALEQVLTTKRIEYGTDGNTYVLSMTNGKELQQEPYDDCISRENLLKVFKDECTGECDNCSNFRKVDGEYKCGLIVDLPSVTSKEKTGHWEYVQYDYNPNIGNWHCSECRSIVIMCVNKKETGGTLYKYCPNCGARMVNE